MFKKALLIVTIALAGCSANPKTIPELKKVGFKDSFSVSQNYQKTYRNIVQGFSVCGRTEASWLSPVAVKSELYTDIQQGQITVKIVPTVGRETPITYLEIDGKQDNQSTVTIFYLWEDRKEPNGKVFRKLAAGQFDCE